MRVLTVKSARLQTITKKPVIVLSHDFDNISNKTIKVNKVKQWKIRFRQVGPKAKRRRFLRKNLQALVETELLPGQAATAVLSANKGALEVEVVYLAKLRGNVAVNFKIPYKGHHFWGPSVDSVMKSGGLENEVIIKETIKLGFYTDAFLNI
ncbi:unnamed protein product [Parnassius apollo]|uniref:(apollo) hypothetical protein n=1 Tax=Parnassius apollo TaxID=110799 RepID=A0A8S3WNP4_PARAO|nr:unnamed protein product [Parnassius apollo]